MELMKTGGFRFQGKDLEFVCGHVKFEMRIRHPIEVLRGQWPGEVTEGQRMWWKTEKHTKMGKVSGMEPWGTLVLRGGKMRRNQQRGRKTGQGVRKRVPKLVPQSPSS